MKKVASSLVGLGLAAAVAAGLVVWKRTGADRLRHAAELLPGETVFFAEVPDFEATRLRWKETALWKIWREPEVQAFLERPRSKMPKSAEWDAALAHWRGAKPHGAFFAVTAIEENMPRMVGGFSYDGPKEEVEAVIAKLRQRAQAASPTGKAALEKYHDFEIESFSHEGVTVAGTFAGNWYFAANDLPLLKATLDRFVSGKGEGSLKESGAFHKSIAQLPPNPDFTLYGRPALFFERLIALSAVSGQPVDPKQAEELRKIEAVAAATRLEGERIRDSVFILSPGAEQVPKLSRGTLKLTSPDTLLYYATALVLPDRIDLPEGNPATQALTLGLKAIQQRLEEQGVRGEDAKAAFGPEAGLLVNWGAASARPQLVAAAEVRDSALASKFAEAICAGWTRQESGAATFFSQPAGSSSLPVSFAAALTKGFFIWGLDLDSVQAAAARAEAGGDVLEKAKPFQGALATVPAPQNALAYLDTKALFERTYSAWRPAAMLWGSMIPAVAQYVDVTKLPLPETISRHLQPSILSSGQKADGFFLESTGTVTIYQGVLGMSALAGAAAAPVLQGKIPLPGMTLPRVPGGAPKAAPSQPALPPPSSPSAEPGSRTPTPPTEAKASPGADGQSLR